MSRLVVVMPLDPLGVGDGFSLKDWPLHLTVAPTFVIGGDIDDSVAAGRFAEDGADPNRGDAETAKVLAAITPMLAEQPQLTVRAGQDAGFGHTGKIPVTLIEPSAGLVELHQRLVNALLAIGAVFDDPEFVGRGYGPHITVTRAGRVALGDSVTFRQAALVDMAPAGDHRLRRVVWTHALR